MVWHVSHLRSQWGTHVEGAEASGKMRLGPVRVDQWVISTGVEGRVLPEWAGRGNEEPRAGEEEKREEEMWRELRKNRSLEVVSWSFKGPSMHRVSGQRGWGRRFMRDTCLEYMHGPLAKSLKTSALDNRQVGLNPTRWRRPGKPTEYQTRSRSWSSQSPMPTRLWMSNNTLFLSKT